ncbi:MULTISPECIES: protein YpfM [Klebsiella/Raoultella group]
MFAPSLGNWKDFIEGMLRK